MDMQSLASHFSDDRGKAQKIMFKKCISTSDVVKKKIYAQVFPLRDLHVFFVVLLC
jgi:hypothetical protein